jgi:GNAT superfamily N-acetyltransferase
MRILPATEKELDAAVTLVSAQFVEHRIELAPGALAAALRVLMTEPKRGAVLLAYDPGPIGIAVLAYTWTLEHGGQVAWLEELYVAPERRGQGVGLALLRRALAFAKDAGSSAVDLEVDVEHERAERLYEREGFQRLPRRRWARPL